MRSAAVADAPASTSSRSCDRPTLQLMFGSRPSLGRRLEGQTAIPTLVLDRHAGRNRLHLSSPQVAGTPAFSCTLMRMNAAGVRGKNLTFRFITPRSMSSGDVVVESFTEPPRAPCRG